jgi:uncharacterized protein
MRLGNQQAQGIITALDPYLSGHSASLFLYGSRVRDDLKGGDIDLLLLANTDIMVKKLRSEKHILLSQVKKYIGDQKIDITIANYTDTTTDPFLKIIMPQANLLHQWK